MKISPRTMSRILKYDLHLGAYKRATVIYWPRHLKKYNAIEPNNCTKDSKIMHIARLFLLMRNFSVLNGRSTNKMIMLMHSYWKMLETNSPDFSEPAIQKVSRSGETSLTTLHLSISVKKVLKPWAQYTETCSTGSQIVKWNIIWWRTLGVLTRLCSGHEQPSWFLDCIQVLIVHEFPLIFPIPDENLITAHTSNAKYSFMGTTSIFAYVYLTFYEPFDLKFLQCEFKLKN